MRYHYKILDNKTNVILFDAKVEGMEPWHTEKSCKRDAQYQQEDTGVKETSYIQVYSVPETIAEEAAELHKQIIADPDNDLGYMHYVGYTDH